MNAFWAIADITCLDHTIVGSTSFVTYESRWPGRVTKPFFEGLAVCHTSLEMILFEK